MINALTHKSKERPEDKAPKNKLLKQFKQFNEEENGEE